jgi:hypothetical protein
MEQYAAYASVKKIAAIGDLARKQLYDLLGLHDDGALKQGGYLETVIKDKVIPAKIKKEIAQNIVSKANVDTFKEGIELSVNGDESGKGGALDELHKEVTNDIVATADRLVGEQFRGELGLNFGIYEGSIIRTSRDFCIDHAGKLYHTSEIEKFDPKTAKPPGYNPFIDLGGYNCRHFFNWVSDELAIRIRPDAAQFIPGYDETTD